MSEVYQATGALEIGRSWWANTWTHHPNWHGTIDDVRVFAGALPDTEVAKLHQP